MLCIVDHKVLKIPDNVNQFDKKRSVFSDWVKDDDYIVGLCVDYDFENGQFDKLVRDSKDNGAMKKFLIEYFSDLKEIRVGAIALSGEPPTLTQI